MLASHKARRKAKGKNHVILEVIPNNDTAIKLSSTLLGIQETLPESIKQSMECRTKQPDPSTNYYESDSDDDEMLTWEDLDNKFGSTNIAVFPLTLNNKQPAGWVIGKTSANSSNNTTLINVPTNLPKEGTQNQNQVLIYLAPISGVLMVRSLNQNGPIFIMEDFKWEAINYDQARVLRNPTTHLRVGRLDYQLCAPPAIFSQYTSFILHRNQSFGEAGVAIPDSRIWGLLGKKPLDRIGSVVVHSTVEDRGFGWVMIGVDIETGEPRLVKEYRVKDHNERKRVFKEAYLSLSSHNAEGLLRIEEMRCQHDEAVDQMKLQKNGAKAMVICNETREKIYFIYPKLLGSFETLKVEDLPLSVRTQYMLGPAQGVLALYEKGFTHGDIRKEFMFVTSDNPPVAVLGAFHAASYLPKSTELNPKAAEESDAAKRDIESLGKVYCYLLSPEVHQLNGPDWRYRWIQSLDKFLGRDHDTCEGLANVVMLITSMLMEDPAKRPLIGEVVNCLARNYERNSGEAPSISSSSDDDESDGEEC